MVTKLEADVVVLGAGFGGLVCALVAHEAGLDTVVVEKSHRLGGVTALSAGHIWVPGNEVAQRAGHRGLVASGSGLHRAHRRRNG